MSPIQTLAQPTTRSRVRPRIALLTILSILTAVGVVLVPASGNAHALARASQTMYTPPSNAPAPGSLYPRALRLEHSGSANGTLLATFEQYTSSTPVFPIYRSTDGGNSWRQISSVADTRNGWGMRWEPFLYELPTAVGNLPAGTILVAGDSVPSDRSATKMDLYASTDHGVTWSFVSNVATGGEAISSNGYTPVWEPFLLDVNGTLICYYSDQRDTNHGQKLVHQTTTDGVHWGPVVNDVTYPTYADRPGMATVAQLPNGNYVMTYEFGGAPEGDYSVYYKISSDPQNFGAVTGIPLKTTSGTVPCCNPFITWLPTGGPDGTLVVSAQSSTDLFLNTQNGAANAWTEIQSTVAGGYSRGLLPLADGHSLLVLSGGYNGSSINPVTYGTIDLGGGISDGAAIVQNTGSGGRSQQWTLLSEGGGYYKLQDVGSGLVAGVGGSSITAGAGVIQWTNINVNDQLWQIERVN